MNIQDALKETGRAALPGSDDFAQKHNGELMWCRIAGDAMGILACVGWKDIARDNWQPYHEEKEIRPEKAGELWCLNKRGFWYITQGYQPNEVLGIVHQSGTHHVLDDKDIIHNKNGWKLLYSPDKEVMARIKEVENESVEKLEIEIASWDSGRYSFRSEYKGGLVGKKCMLEIPKDKP